MAKQKPIFRRRLTSRVGVEPLEQRPLLAGSRDLFAPIAGQVSHGVSGTPRFATSADDSTRSLDQLTLAASRPLVLHATGISSETLPRRATKHDQPLFAAEAVQEKLVPSHGPAITSSFVTPGVAGQTVEATFKLSRRQAAYRNEVGLFLVDDASGRIDGLSPGERGYRSAAMARRITLFGRHQAAGATTEVILPGGSYFGLYLARNASAERYLAAATAHRPGPVVFFSFPAANSDRFGHFRLPAGDVVSIEDQRGGGDRDFNDAILRMNFLTTGSGTTPPRVDVPPNPPDKLDVDDSKPIVTLASPAEGLLTNHSTTVVGRATDVGTGVATLYASVDAASFIAITFDTSTGAFQLPVALALDGTADGHHTVAFYAVDGANNKSDTVSVGFNLDATAPIVSLSSPAAGLVTNGNVTVVGRAADSLSGLASLSAQVDGGPSMPLAVDAAGNFRVTTALATDGTADGPHVVRLVATDKAGNASAPSDLGFTLDDTPPLVTVTHPTASLSTNMSLAIAGLVADKLSGVATLTAQLDGGEPLPVAVDADGGYSFTPSLPLDGTADGSHAVRLEATDKAGNRTDPVTVAFTLDTTAPSIAITSPAPDLTGRTSPVVTGRVTDTLSGIAMLRAQIDGGPFADVSLDGSGNFSFPTTLATDGSADGPHVVRLVATDKAGNASAPSTLGFTLDTTAPLVTVTHPTATLTTNMSLAIAGLVTDKLSGVATLTAQLDGGELLPVAVEADGGFSFTPSLTLDGTADGFHAVRLVATDKAGNSSDPLTVAFTLDTTAPLVTILAPADDPTGRTNLDVIGKVADGLSRVQTLRGQVDSGPFLPVTFDSAGNYRFTTSLATDGSADGRHVIGVQATDAAGNVSMVVVASFTLDTTPPAITATGPDPGQLTNRNVSITGQATDALSGVAGLSASVDGGPAVAVTLDAAGAFTFATALATDGSADGLHTVRLVATDRAGNASAARSYTFNLDATPPALPVFGLDPASDTLPLGDGSTTFATVTLVGKTDPATTVKFGDRTTVADASGLFSFAGVALQLGANMFTVLAVDAAGNSSQYSATINRGAPCGFEDGLTGWAVGQDGGSAAGKGTVTAAQGQATLVEGDSFDVTLERDFVVPAGATSLNFTYAGPAFDTSSTGLAKDAFEVALLDPSGSSLLTPFAAGRDAFFNVSEGQAPALGTGATLNNGTVTVDLSGVAAGTTARLVFRLVNNDADTRTAVTLTCAMFPDGATFVTPSSPANPGSGSIRASATGLVLTPSTASGPAAHPIVGTPGVVSGSAPVAAPGLTITSPLDRSQVAAGTSVLITGTATARVVAGSSSAAVPNRIVDVTVNGTPVQVLDAGGNFFEKVTVAPGEDRYEVVATDTFGQTSHATLTLDASAQPTAQVDFSSLSDISASFAAEYARTSYRAATSTLYADVAIANRGNYPANVPLYVGVTHLSDPAVRVLDAAGTTPDGTPYYDFTQLVAGGGTLAPNAATGTLSLTFADPGQARFTYDLVFFGLLNRAPAFTTLPVVMASIGHPYAYRAQAEDGDGDPLTYSLLAGPAGMAIDPASGAIAWTPAVGDQGTHAVQVQVNDGRGGSAEQDFTLTAAVAPPDRPPVFTSAPVTTANATATYTYRATAEDLDGDVLVFSSGDHPPGMKIDAVTGVVTWTPTAAQVGAVAVTLEVSDGLGGVATQTFTVCVMPAEGNHAPVIVSTAPTTLGLIGQVGATTSSVSPTTLQLSVPAGGTSTQTVSLTLPTSGVISGSADIIFVVDESGSMATEQAWLQSLATTLDAKLAAAGITNNRYGLVGFTDSGRTLPVGGQLFGSASQFATAAKSLVTTRGGTEDGYLGIDYALSHYTFRADAAANVVLVTDEDRDIVTKGLTYASIRNELVAKNAGLTVVVNAPVHDSAGKVGIGIADDLTTYRADGAGGYVVGSKGTVTSGDGTTKADYIDLAWQGGGTSWDLNQLKAGGLVAQSFTTGFTSILSRDIAERLTTTVVSSDPTVAVTNLTGPLTGIGPGGTATFTVGIASDGRPRAFSLDFVRVETGAIIGTIPILLNADLTYTVAAVDPDGDKLTYRLISPMAGATIDPDSGLFRWSSPGPGAYTFKVAVEDGRGGVDNQDFTIAVGIGGEIRGTVFNDSNQGSSPPQFSQTVHASVSGLSDPWLAGLPDGSKATYSDVAPAQSPQTVIGVPLIAGTVLTFAATGGVTNQAGPFLLGPDGGLFTRHTGGMQNGIADATIPINSLVGIFLGPDLPSASAAPAALDFGPGGNVSGGLNYASLAPALKQVFFIGDGLDANGNRQKVVVPAGATRLLLGTMDAYDWFNNAGQFAVDVTNQAPGLAGWTVYLDRNGNGRLDSEEPTTVSDADGRYAFTGVGAGPYRVDEVIQPGWTRDLPAAPYVGNLAASQVITGLDFGNHFTGTATPAAIHIASTAAPTATTGLLYQYDILVTGGAPGPLTFDLPAAPAGMTVHPTLGVLVWSPTADEIGPQTVVLRVRDAAGQFALQSFTVDVSFPNTAPVITTATLPGPAGVGLAYRTPIAAQDAEGDPVSFSLASPIAGMRLDERTGVLTWTPTLAEVGTQQVVVVATDGRGGRSSRSFDLTVAAQPGNAKPLIAGPPRTSTWLGRDYVVPVRASDPDGDPLSFTLTPNAPAGMTIDAAGVLRWTPDAAQLGPNPVEVVASDGRGGTATLDFTVVVTMLPVNSPPVITSSPPLRGTVDRPYAVAPQASDADGDPVTWSLDAAPTGMSVDPATGALRWTPTSDQLGPQHVVIRATDALQASTTQAFDVDVACVDLAPALTSTPTTTASVATLYTYAVRAVDPEGEPLTFSFAAKPDGMTIDEHTGLIRWSPTPGQVGTRNVAILVNDGQGNVASQTYQVVVAAPAADAGNLPPVVTSIPITAVLAGQAYRYVVTAGDPDGDPVTLSSPTILAGLTFDSSTDVLTWTPTANQIGIQVLTVVATDSHGARGTQSFAVSVRSSNENQAGGNHAPHIFSTAVTAAVAGITYHYDVRARDADNDPLTYTVAGPPGMTIDALGRITWAVAPKIAGSYPVTVTVRDPFGATDTRAFDLVVGADAEPPQVAVFVTSTLVDVHSPVTVRVVASDNVGVASLGLTLDGQAVALDASGSATVMLDTQEIAQLVGTATDVAGNVGTGSAQVRVLDPTDTRAPTVTITSPTPGAILGASTAIRGTVAVGPGETLEFYTVEVAPADQVDLGDIGAANSAFHAIGRGTSPVADGVLATFDPTLVADDGYVIRVTAFDTNGHGTVLALPVEVAGGAKLGNFHLAITDLSIPVAGLPIQVTRIYDTLNAATSGDFGFGWTLGVQDAQIRETVPQTPQAFFSTGAAFRDGTRVYLTAPDGTREGFTFHPYATGGLLGAIWHPKFVADPGVYDTLSVPDFAMMQKSDGTFAAYLFGFAYNPDDYTLATTDGTKYQYNQFSGLQKITDPNGNTLTFSASGIVSSTGVAVSFTRDGQGRITKVTEPDGHAISYRYNASGNLAAVTDADGMTTTYGYLATPAHFLSTATDAMGHQTFQAQFDANGRLTSSTDALGNTASQNFDSGTFTGTRTDGLKRVTNLVYDARGNILTETDPMGAVTRYEYGDPANPDKPTKVIDPDSHATTYAYDARGNTIATTNALNQTYRATYNAQNKVTTATDPLGHIVTSIYDARGNLTSFVNAAGTASTLTYDAQGRQTSSTDNNGHTTTYEYASGSLPTRINNPDNTHRTIAYNALGLPTLITDELGNKLTTTYDASGRVLTVRDAAGGLTSYVYDAAGNLTLQTDPLNHVTRYEYDAANHRVRTIAVLKDATNPNALDSVTTDKYDAAGELLSTTDANGHTTTNSYYDDGRLKTVTDALNGVTTYEYDAAGNRTAVTDALNRRRTYDYDVLNRLIAQHDCTCATAYLTYDAVGNLASRIDRNSNATTFTYDALNQLVAETDALSGVNGRVYDPEGNLVALTDANGHTTRYAYDSRNRLVKETDPLGNAIQYGYDDAGNQTSVTDQFNKVTHFTYDGMGRLLTTVAPDGGTTTNTYDLAGNLTSTVDLAGNLTNPLKRTTSYAYDPLNRLITETDASNGVTTYTYDAVGNRTSLTDSDHNKTTFEYDDLDRLIKETDPLGHVTTYKYDAVGNQIEEVDRDGRRRTFAYDELNRQTDEFWWDGTTVVRDIHTTYDFVGNVLTQSDPDSTYTFTYDALNRVLTVDNAGTPGAPHVVLTSVYDAVGNRIKVSDNSGVTVGSTYDADDHLTSRTWQGGGVAPARIDFAYDARGEQIGVTRYSDLAGVQRIGSTTTAYDDLGRTKSITHLDALDAVLASYDYTYDLASQLVTEVRDGETIQYTNDATGQLTGADRSGGSDESYSFDPNGNRTSGSYVVGPDNQLLSDGKFNYSYDSEGNLVRKVEIATGNVTIYSFDYRNRLTEVVERTSSGVVVNDVQYVYDVMGRLITRVVNGQTLHTDYDGDNVWSDYGPTGVAASHYLFGDGTDQILARSRTGEGTAWYLKDQLGTVRNIAGANGAVINHLDYDSFGNIVEQTNTGAGDRFTYTGREFEAVIGLYFYRARFYDSRTGRFTSEDPLRFSAGDTNLRRYVNNAAVGASDPTGLEAAEELAIDENVSTVILKGVSVTQKVATIGSDFSESAVAANDNIVGGASIFARSTASAGQLGITQGILNALGLSAIVLLLTSDTTSDISGNSEKSAYLDLGVVSLEARERVTGSNTNCNNNQDKPKDISYPSDFFDNTFYTDKVKSQINQGDYHSFPESVTGLAADGTVDLIQGGDCQFRERLRIPGNYRGKDGFFEFIKNSDGSINHRLFRPNK